jgi:hypothetical protein
LAVLQDDKRRAELIGTLEAIAKASPAAPAPAPAPASAPVVPLAPDSLGAQLVNQFSSAVSDAGTEVLNSVRSVNDLPLLWRWLSTQARDPEARKQIGDAAWKLVAIFACALLAEWLVRRLFRRLRATLSAWAPATANEEPAPRKRQSRPPRRARRSCADGGWTGRSARCDNCRTCSGGWYWTCCRSGPS